MNVSKGDLAMLVNSFSNSRITKHAGKIVEVRRFVGKVEGAKGTVLWECKLGKPEKVHYVGSKLECITDLVLIDDANLRRICPPPSELKEIEKESAI